MDWLPAGSRPFPTLSGTPGPASALAVAALVAGAGYAARALTARGALAAAVVGAAVLAWSGWPGAAALAVFFVGSSALPHALPVGMAQSGGDPKGDRRDVRQVLANGGAAAVSAFVLRTDPSLALWAATCSLAAAAADTWATATGGTSPRPPRRLLLGPAVPPGTNGGMTWRGSAGAVAGAVTVAAAGGVAAGDPRLMLWAVPVGVAGMLLDSALGATLQGRHRCDACETASDWRRHHCGRPTRHTGGLAWLDNDAVNLAATGAAAIAGVLGWHLARG